MNFRPELSWEFYSESEIATRTERALRNHVQHVVKCSSFYRTLLNIRDVEAIGSPAQYQTLPLTDRLQIIAQPSDFLGVASNQVVETVYTAGTAGDPLAFAYTSSDLERLAFSFALSLNGAGVTHDDRVLILTSLDSCRFEGMAVYRGAVMAGAHVLRAGAELSSVTIDYGLSSFKPTVLVATPSVLKRCATLYSDEINREHSSIQKLIVTGSPVLKQEQGLNATGTMLAALWGASVYSLYSSSESAVSYCSAECQNGAHAHPELVYTEIVDESGRVVPDGEVGELVVTPLGVEGMPLVRYRTGDMTFKSTGPCGCGRNSVRIGPILGRKAHLFSIDETVIYPHTVFSALDGLHEIKDYLLILESDGTGRDKASIQIAASPSVLEKTAYALKDATGVLIPVLISNIPTLQAIRTKAHPGVPLLDKRNKYQATPV